LQSHSLFYPYPLSERALTVRGARITAPRAAQQIAVSIRFSNAWLRFRGTADFARPIHFQPMAPQAQPMAPQGNREGAIGVTIRIPFALPRSVLTNVLASDIAPSTNFARLHH
jgi:hypothetical protein